MPAIPYDSVIGSTVYEVDADLSKFNKGIQTAELRSKQSTSNIKNHLLSIGKVAAVALPAAAATAGIAAIKMSSDFNKGIRESRTIIGDMTDNEIATLRKETLAFMRDTGNATSKVMPALYNSLSAGIPKNNVFEFIRVANKAAVAGVTDVNVAVDGLSSAVNAYSARGLEAKRASDIFFSTVRSGKTTFEQLSKNLSNVADVAAGANIPFEEMMASIATLTSGGARTSVATTRLRQTIIELIKPGKDLEEALEAIGFQSGQVALEQHGLQGTLKLLREEADRQNKSMVQLFSSQEAGMAALGLTGANSERAAKHLEAARNSAGETEKAFKTMRREMGYLIERMKGFGRVALITIGNVALPYIMDMMEALIAVMERIDFDRVAKGIDSAARLIIRIVDLVVSSIVFGAGYIHYIITNILNAVGVDIYKLWTLVRSLWTGLVDFIDRAVNMQLDLPTMLSVAIDELGKWKDGILKWMSDNIIWDNVINKIKLTWDRTVEFGGDTLAVVKAKILDWWNQLNVWWTNNKDTILTRIAISWSDLITLTGSIIYSLGNKIKDWIKAGQRWWAENKDSVITSIKINWNSLISITGSIIYSLGNKIKGWINAGRRWWAENKDSVLTSIEISWSQLVTITGSVVGNIGNKIKLWIKAGQDWWAENKDSILTSISIAWSDLVTITGSIANSIAEKIKAWFTAGKKWWLENKDDYYKTVTIAWSDLVTLTGNISPTVADKIKEWWQAGIDWWNSRAEHKELSSFSIDLAGLINITSNAIKSVASILKDWWNAGATAIAGTEDTPSILKKIAITLDDLVEFILPTTLYKSLTTWITDTIKSINDVSISDKISITWDSLVTFTTGEATKLSIKKDELHTLITDWIDGLVITAKVNIEWDSLLDFTAGEATKLSIKKDELHTLITDWIDELAITAKVNIAWDSLITFTTGEVTKLSTKKDELHTLITDWIDGLVITAKVNIEWDSLLDFAAGEATKLSTKKDELHTLITDWIDGLAITAKVNIEWDSIVFFVSGTAESLAAKATEFYDTIKEWIKELFGLNEDGSSKVAGLAGPAYDAIKTEFKTVADESFSDDLATIVYNAITFALGFLLFNKFKTSASLIGRILATTGFAQMVYSTILQAMETDIEWNNLVTFISGEAAELGVKKDELQALVTDWIDGLAITAKVNIEWDSIVFFVSGTAESLAAKATEFYDTIKEWIKGIFGLNEDGSSKAAGLAGPAYDAIKTDFETVANDTFANDLAEITFDAIAFALGFLLFKKFQLSATLLGTILRTTGLSQMIYSTVMIAIKSDVPWTDIFNIGQASPTTLLNLTKTVGDYIVNWAKDLLFGSGEEMDGGKRAGLSSPIVPQVMPWTRLVNFIQVTAENALTLATTISDYIQEWVDTQLSKITIANAISIMWIDLIEFKDSTAEKIQTVKQGLIDKFKIFVDEIIDDATRSMWIALWAVPLSSIIFDGFKSAFTGSEPITRARALFNTMLRQVILGGLAIFKYRDEVDQMLDIGGELSEQLLADPTNAQYLAAFLIYIEDVFKIFSTALNSYLENHLENMVSKSLLFGFHLLTRNFTVGRLAALVPGLPGILLGTMLDILIFEVIFSTDFKPMWDKHIYPLANKIRDVVSAAVKKAGEIISGNPEAGTAGLMENMFMAGQALEENLVGRGMIQPLKIDWGQLIEIVSDSSTDRVAKGQAILKYIFDWLNIDVFGEVEPVITEGGDLSFRVKTGWNRFVDIIQETTETLTNMAKIVAAFILIFTTIFLILAIPVVEVYWTNLLTFIQGSAEALIDKTSDVVGFITDWITEYLFGVNVGQDESGAWVPVPTHWDKLIMFIQGGADTLLNKALDLAGLIADWITLYLFGDGIEQDKSGAWVPVPTNWDKLIMFVQTTTTDTADNLLKLMQTWWATFKPIFYNLLDLDWWYVMQMDLNTLSLELLLSENSFLRWAGTIGTATSSALLSIIHMVENAGGMLAALAATMENLLGPGLMTGGIATGVVGRGASYRMAAVAARQADREVFFDNFVRLERQQNIINESGYRQTGSEIRRDRGFAYARTQPTDTMYQVERGITEDLIGVTTDSRDPGLTRPVSGSNEVGLTSANEPSLDYKKLDDAADLQIDQLLASGQIDDRTRALLGEDLYNKLDPGRLVTPGALASAEYKVIQGLFPTSGFINPQAAERFHQQLSTKIDIGKIAQLGDAPLASAFSPGELSREEYTALSNISGQKFTDNYRTQLFKSFSEQNTRAQNQALINEIERTVPPSGAITDTSSEVSLNQLMELEDLDDLADPDAMIDMGRDPAMLDKLLDDPLVPRYIKTNIRHVRMLQRYKELGIITSEQLEKAVQDAIMLQKAKRTGAATVTPGATSRGPYVEASLGGVDYDELLADRLAAAGLIDPSTGEPYKLVQTDNNISQFTARQYAIEYDINSGRQNTALIQLQELEQNVANQRIDAQQKVGLQYDVSSQALPGYVPPGTVAPPVGQGLLGLFTESIGHLNTAIMGGGVGLTKDDQGRWRNQQGQFASAPKGLAVLLGDAADGMKKFTDRIPTAPMTTRLDNFTGGIKRLGTAFVNSGIITAARNIAGTVGDVAGATGDAAKVTAGGIYENTIEPLLPNMGPSASTILDFDEEGVLIARQLKTSERAANYLQGATAKALQPIANNMGKIGVIGFMLGLIIDTITHPQFATDFQLFIDMMENWVEVLGSLETTMWLVTIALIPVFGIKGIIALGIGYLISFLGPINTLTALLGLLQTMLGSVVLTGIGLIFVFAQLTKGMLWVIGLFKDVSEQMNAVDLFMGRMATSAERVYQGILVSAKITREASHNMAQNIGIAETDEDIALRESMEFMEANHPTFQNTPINPDVIPPTAPYEAMIITSESFSVPAGAMIDPLKTAWTNVTTWITDTAIPAFLDTMKKLWETVKQYFLEKFQGGLLEVFNLIFILNLPNFLLLTFIPAIMNVFGWLWDSIANWLFDSEIGFLQAIGNWMKSIGSAFGLLGSVIKNALVSKVGEAIDAVKERLESLPFVSGLMRAVSWIGEKIGITEEEAEKDLFKDIENRLIQEENKPSFVATDLALQENIFQLQYQKNLEAMDKKIEEINSLPDYSPTSLQELPSELTGVYTNNKGGLYEVFGPQGVDNVDVRFKASAGEIVAVGQPGSSVDASSSGGGNRTIQVYIENAYADDFADKVHKAIIDKREQGIDI